jgi:hypothetical protein
MTGKRPGNIRQIAFRDQQRILSEVSRLTDAEINARYGKNARWTADGKRLISITVDGYRIRVNRIKTYQKFTFSNSTDPNQFELGLEVAR